MLTEQEWQEHNEHERAWWGDCLNTSDEEFKQLKYALLMGLEQYSFYAKDRRFGNGYDLGGRSVLDVGGGPVSLLLKCRNLGPAWVVDPCRWPGWIMARYEAAAICYLQQPAENQYLDGQLFDEVWLYNVLQHVYRPEDVARNALAHLKPGGNLRVFEWIETMETPGHPHVLTAERLNVAFGVQGQVVDTLWPACPTQAWAVAMAKSDRRYTVTVTSTGRFSLLKRMIESLKATLGPHPPERILISDDSGNKEQGELIKGEWDSDPMIECHFQDARHGQAWNVDYVLGLVKTPWVFMCEDDWEFTRTGYIKNSFRIMESEPSVALVGLVIDDRYRAAGAVGEWHVTDGGTAYYDHAKWRLSDQHDWWHGWVGSPHLMRMADLRSLGRFQDYMTEGDWDRHFGEANMRSVWLDQQYAHHTGDAVSTFAPGVAHMWVQRYPSFRFHLLGLPHVPTHRDVSCCAYTQKAVKLAAMLTKLGHDVILYAGEGSQADCREIVQVVSEADRVQTYGHHDWHREFFKFAPSDHAYQTFQANAIVAINERKQARDFLLCPWGNFQQPIAEAVNLMAVESGIGYQGVFAKYRVFESYAWMHHVYGLLGMHDGSWYDAVIPNYYHPADFPFCERKDGDFLYFGRLVGRKGVQVAVETTRALGAKLLCVGQGSLVNPAEGLNISDAHVEHRPAVGPEERAQLLGHARAVFLPTSYIEPFGGVAVEAMFCGTPVITSDWGAFTETVQHGVTGWRCRTLKQFIWGAEHAGDIKPEDCRRWAVDNYSCDRVALMYQAYFEQLWDLWQPQGWMLRESPVENLDWLRRA